MTSIETSLISFIFTISINVHQLAPVPFIRFQTKLGHSRSGHKSPHTNYTNCSTAVSTSSSSVPTINHNETD
jgi:hypothetical protein